MLDLIEKYQKEHISPEKDSKLGEINNTDNNNIIIEYQKIINLLDNTPNQPSAFRTKI